MAKKSGIRPPRKPRGEAPSVTIGNLELQLRNLAQRIEELAHQREQTHSALLDARTTLARVESWRKADVSRLEECQAKLASTEQRFEGYRQAVADLHFAG